MVQKGHPRREDTKKPAKNLLGTFVDLGACRHPLPVCGSRHSSALDAISISGTQSSDSLGNFYHTGAMPPGSFFSNHAGNGIQRHGSE